MTVSRTSRPIAVLALAVGVALPAAASAQAPAFDPSPVGQPRSLAPPRSLETAPEPESSARGTQVLKGGGIQAHRLEAVDIDAAGAISVAQGGLGPSMWHGTSRRFVDSLLPHLPVKARSPALRGLMRRFLMTGATPPEGDAVPGRLMALRLDLLDQMGDPEATGALMAAVPVRARTEPMIRRQTDMALLGGDVAKACGTAANQVRSATLAYWQKLLTFCQMLAGEAGKASLGAELLRETGEADAGFFALFDVLNGMEPSGLETLTDPEPQHLAMARAAKVVLPMSDKASHAAVLRSVALDPALPIPLRLSAAERAEKMGAFPALTLRELYSAVPFTEEELTNPLSSSEATPTEGTEGAPPEIDPALRTRALLFHTALHQDVDSVRAEAVSAVLERAKAEDRFASAARVLLPALEALEPSAGFAWLARDMVRALLVTGRVERAGAWFRLLKGNAALNPESAKAMAQLKPLMRLAGAKEAEDWSPRDLAAWAQAADGGAGGGLLFSLIEGFEEFIPDGLWNRLSVGSLRRATDMPDATLWRRLETAARLGRTGEAVLLSLVMFGEGGPAAAHPLVLRHVVRSLRASGLEDVAREIAVEAAVAGLR